MIGYWPAIIISLMMHGLLLAALAWGAQFFPQKTVEPPPSFIKASLVSIEPASKPTATKPKPKQEIPKAAPPKPPPKKVDLTKQRQEQERLKKLAVEKKKQNQIAKQKAEQVEKETQALIQREKAEKLAAEKLAKETAEAEARKQQELEKLRLQAEQERKQQEEQERQRIQREQQQQAFREDLAKEKAQRDAERAAEKEAQQAAEDEVAKQSYSALIQKRVTDSWSRPPSARNNMLVELTIELIPTGEVINVNVTDSSGNAAFDRSAVRAVNRVGAFPELREMPRRLFDSEFRSFKLKFSPEDLRQ